MTASLDDWAKFPPGQFVAAINQALVENQPQGLLNSLLYHFSIIHPTEFALLKAAVAERTEINNARIQVPLEVPEVHEQGGHEHEHDQVPADVRASHRRRGADGARRPRGSKS
jgi:hypothetical protein